MEVEMGTQGAELLSTTSLTWLICFLGVLAVMSVWEVVAPRRRLTVSKGPRWASNLGLVVLNAVVTRIVIPVSAVGLAEFMDHRGWGLINLGMATAWPE